MIAIAPFGPGDRAEWERLARGYKAFYATDHPDSVYDDAWRRLLAGEELHGLAARIDGQMVGIAHYLFHAQTWSADACYLQDLYTAEDSRGRGVAAALIDAVGADARARGAAKFYWMTKEDNAQARALYDRVARFKGFLRYNHPL